MRFPQRVAGRVGRKVAGLDGLPVIPHALQRAALAMGAPLGRAVGYRPVYEPVGEAAVA